MFASYKYRFKEINPSKIYSEFTFTDLKDYKDVDLSFCQNNEIIRIDGSFYLFARRIEELSAKQQPSVIQFCKRRKVIHEIIIDIALEKKYYVLEIVRDVEPVLSGARRTTLGRDELAMKLHDEYSSVFWLNINQHGEPVIGSYTSDFFEK